MHNRIDSHRPHGYRCSRDGRPSARASKNRYKPPRAARHDNSLGIGLGDRYRATQGRPGSLKGQIEEGRKGA
jgi:hypothetical protein